MQKPNTHSQLKNWIGSNFPALVEARTWKKISKMIQQALGTQVNSQEVYDIMYPESRIACESARYIQFSVGYRTCRKNCPCYKQRLAASVSRSKKAATDQRKAEIQAKRTATVRDRYQVDNVFQLPTVKQASAATKLAIYGDPGFTNPNKAKTTNLSRYGVENPMQVPEIAAKNQRNRDYVLTSQRVQDTKQQKYGDRFYRNPDKAKTTNLDRYGVENPAKNLEVRSKISQALIRYYVPRHGVTYGITPAFDTYQPGHVNPWHCIICGSLINGTLRNGRFTKCKTCYPSGSLPERQVRDFITGLGFDIVENSRTVIPPWELDIFVPALNLAVEYCGTYWHSEQHGKHRNYHKNKLDKAAEQGIRLITLFSNHWIDRPDLVKSRLLQIMQLQSQRMFARTCKVQTLSDREYRDFIEQAHLQGYCRAKHKYGLINNHGNIVAAMSFSKSRFEPGSDEMIRFATSPGLTVIGAASRLLVAHVRAHAPTSIVTYSDNCWGYSNFYETLGFTRISQGNPGYSYINTQTDCRPINRMRFQKHKLADLNMVYDPSLSEVENMRANGYQRIWDCGHSKYLMIIKG